MKYFALMFILSSAFAQTSPTTPRTNPAVEQGSRSVLTPMPAAPRTPTRPEQLRPSDRQRLQQGQDKIRSGGAGGDDVGNGGDELRLAFLSQAQQWLYAFPAFTAFVDANRIIVVEGLEVAGERKPYVVTNGVVLLDQASWDPSAGLLSASRDSRLLVFNILQEMANVRIDSTERLRAWHGLSRTEGTIICAYNASVVSTSVTFVDQTLKGAEQTATQHQALASCQRAGLEECRIVASSMRGFGRMQAEVTVRGNRVSASAMTRQEQRQEQCQAIRHCEEAHEWAPAGQVSNAHFLQIESEANRVCR